MSSLGIKCYATPEMKAAWSLSVNTKIATIAARSLGGKQVEMPPPPPTHTYIRSFPETSEVFHALQW